MGFRERHGYLAPVPLTWEDAPEAFRNRIAQLVHSWAERARSRHDSRPIRAFYSSVCFELGIQASLAAMDSSVLAEAELQGMVQQLPWEELFEVVQIFAHSVDDANIVDSINLALQMDNVGWRLDDDGEFTRLEQDPSARVAVARASHVLQDERLADVRKHYTKALSLFNTLRQPDFENAIKEAILCLESVGKIAAGLPKGTLGDVADHLGGKVIPKPLDSVLRALHGYSSQNWIRHSGGKVSLDEAQFVIVMASNCIAYLATKLPG
jgi:hypothetical protein